MALPSHPRLSFCRTHPVGSHVAAGSSNAPKALPSHSWLSRRTRGSPIAPTVLPSYPPLRALRARVSPVALAWLFYCSHGPPIAPTALPSYPRLFYCSHHFPFLPRLFHHTLGSPQDRRAHGSLVVPTALRGLSLHGSPVAPTALPLCPRLRGFHCTHGSLIAPTALFAHP